jgi:hypothetical protein
VTVTEYGSVLRHSSVASAVAAQCVVCKVETGFCTASFRSVGRHFLTPLHTAGGSAALPTVSTNVNTCYLFVFLCLFVLRKAIVLTLRHCVDICHVVADSV